MSSPHSKVPQMGTICIVSLVIVSVLVQNASGKRGCAAFGHACYGGHGKRSSAGTLPEGFDGDGDRQLAVESLPPLPYAKALLALQMDRSRASSYESAAPPGALMRPGLTELVAVGRGQQSGPIVYAGSRTSEQDRFVQMVRIAVNSVLRQMLEENRLQQRDQQNAIESGQPQEQQQHLQMDSEQN